MRLVCIVIVWFVLVPIGPFWLIVDILHVCNGIRAPTCRLDTVMSDKPLTNKLLCVYVCGIFQIFNDLTILTICIRTCILYAYVMAISCLSCTPPIDVVCPGSQP